MQIRTRLTGFFLLTLTVWSLFLVWANLEFYRGERNRFLTESFNQRLNLLTELIRTEVYRTDSDASPEALAAAKRRALELVREATYPNFSDGYPVIFDEGGKLLFKPDGIGPTGLPPPDIELEKLVNYGFGDFNITLPDGRKRHIISTGIPVWHWVVFYSFPDARASWNEVAQGARTRLGLTAIGCVLLSAVILFFIIRRSLRPIDALAHKATWLASGSFPPADTHYRNDELGVLARAFDDMSIRMHSSYEQLKTANQDSQHSRNFLNAMFNSVDLLVAAVDRDGRITYWNNTIATYTGVTAARGQELWSVAAFLAPTREWLALQLEDQVPRERREVALTIQGVEYWFDILTTPLFGTQEPGAVLVLKNVTAMVQQHDQLLQAQKMETIGTLTGGLAHDFNNVLAGIRGALSMIRLAPDKREQVLEFTGLAESAVTRAAGMVGQLLALARKTPFAIARIDWTKNIQAVVDIARGTFDKRIRIDLELPAEPVWIDADPTQMEQVVLNLLVNAEQAVRSGGGEGHIAVVLRRESAWSGGPRWELTVSDSGPGIRAEILPKIFDPFFSTRAHGKGTGLGLSMVYNIITRHGGRVTATSPAGCGACFRIVLPEAPPPETGETPVAPPLPAPAASAGGVVLLIDDEAAIRQTVAPLLRSFGLTVYTAADGDEGLEVFRRHAPEIDLVLLDMAMPRLSGEETFAGLRKLDPAVRVVIASGYPDDPRMAGVLRAGALELLSKPFSPDELQRVVQRCARRPNRGGDE